MMPANSMKIMSTMKPQIAKELSFDNLTSDCGDGETRNGVCVDSVSNAFKLGLARWMPDNGIICGEDPSAPPGMLFTSVLVPSCGEVV
jgi:hypothetical protein